MGVRVLTILCLACAVTRAETLEQAVRGYLLAAEESPGKPWDVTGALGLAITQNGDSVTFTYRFDGKRDWADVWKLALVLRGIYEETNGAATESEHIFTERLDRRITERGSIFQDLHLETDDEEDLSLRVILTVGYRRELVAKEKFTLHGDAGLGWQYEDFAAASKSDAIGQLGLDFEWKITKHLTFKQKLVYYPRLSDWPEFRFASESVFTTPIGERLDLNLTITDTYNSEPQAGVDHNDIKVTLTISIRFTKPPEKKE